MKTTTTIIEEQIWKAIVDYDRHTEDHRVLEDISAPFVSRLAEDSYNAKTALRDLFSKSSAWNEELQAIVINGTRTHNPDYIKSGNLAREILSPAMKGLDDKARLTVEEALCYFAYPNDPEEEVAKYIEAMNRIAPKAYKEGKKKSRIFKALCKAMGVVDEKAGSEFQKLYAQFADEISSRKIDFKLYVSLHPAHFLTMSNPKCDKRGSTMISCHSLNSREYTYNGGCVGYARDEVSFIVFTADPKNPETLNNRKTSRQMFAYKPYNGLLLQSRMYTTNSGAAYGGVDGDTEEGKLYRDLIQREISELEGAVNLWKVDDYHKNKFGVYIPKGEGFGGYADWIEIIDAGKISIRTDCLKSYENFIVGTYGLCVVCGSETDEGLFCSKGCDKENDCYCDECEGYFSEVFPVRDERNRVLHVCEHCRDEYYRYCEECGQYYPTDYTSYTGDETCVCENCLHEHYTFCEICHEYYRDEDMHTVIEGDGEIEVCGYCFESHCQECTSCGFMFHERLDEEGRCADCHRLHEEEEE